MMSKYAGTNKYDSYSPSSSPRGRRYVLQNLNAKGPPGGEVTFRDKSEYDEYFDIGKAPSTQSTVVSNSSRSSKSGQPIGTSQKILPTELAEKNKTPRKERGELLFVSPRRPKVTPRADVSAINKTPRQLADSEEKDQTKNGAIPSNSDQKDIDANNTMVKKGDKNSPSKGKEGQTKKAVSGKRNEKGLTPRDEYMVTKLYDREIIYLKPSDVRYTHDQCVAHFEDGRSIMTTFIALLYGRIEIRLGGIDVPPIEVMQTEERGKNVWFVVNGNRRLYVFRRLEKCGALTTMPVIARKYDALEMDKHFSTRNSGIAISVVNEVNLRDKIKSEVLRWKEWKAKQPKQKPVQKVTPKPAKASPTRPQANNKSGSCCTIS